jgi:subtilase family serine protease/DNA-directed RNA polymerase subunit RPC12/RpoP
MEIECPGCKYILGLKDSDIPDDGIWGRCPNCNERIFLKKDLEMDIIAKAQKSRKPLIIIGTISILLSMILIVFILNRFSIINFSKIYSLSSKSTNTQKTDASPEIDTKSIEGKIGNLEIEKDILNIKQMILESKKDKISVQGGILGALYQVRIDILTNTLLLLEQRKISTDYSILINYSIDGKKYVPPDNKNELKNELSGEIDKLSKDCENIQDQMKQYTGGLILTTMAAELAMKKNNRALLEQKLVMLKYDIPYYHILDNATRDDTSPKSTAAENQLDKQTETSDQTEALEKKYIKEKLVLYDFKAKYFEGILTGRTPGVVFKIKNNGDKTITELEVTVYFKDKNDNVIAEENYHPITKGRISFSDDSNKPLKPGYIYQLPSDKFLQAKSVASEWKEGNAFAKITDVKFE